MIKEKAWLSGQHFLLTLLEVSGYDPGLLSGWSLRESSQSFVPQILL